MQGVTGSSGLSVGVNYRIKLSMNNSSISASLENLDTQTELLSTSIVDASIPNAGKQILSTNGGSSNVDCDNFAVTNLAP